MKRPLDEYLSEAEEKGWQTLPQTPPRILFEDGGNMLRRVRGYQKLLEDLFPKLDLVVTIDWRMSNTATAQRLRAARGRMVREGRHHLGDAAKSPFSQVITKAVEPWAEAKSDWEVPLPLHEDAATAARSNAASSPTRGSTARSGASTTSTTSTPSAGATPKRTPRRSSTRSSASRRTWAASAGPRSRRRASLALPVIGNGYLSHENAMDVDLNDDHDSLHLAHREEAALADADAPDPVLHRPPLLQRAGRDTAGPQGRPDDRQGTIR